MNKIIAIVLSVLFLAGCEQEEDPGQKFARLENEVQALTSTANSLISAVNQQNQIILVLSQRLDAFESQVEIVYEDDEEEEDCPPPSPPKKATPKSETKKVSSIPSELKERLQEGKLNVVVFKEDWCPHCRRYMAAIKTWDDPNVNFIVVDTSKEPKLAKYKMKNGIPETQLYSGTGQFLAVDSGFSDKENFQKWFNKYHTKKQNTVYVNS
jgi:glutaredoxin/outer membrane murein-binding lipoprotein Lpp